MVGAVVALCALSLRPTEVHAAGPTLLRDPYLTDVGVASAMVNLATDTASPVPIVSWDLAGAGCSSPPNSVAAAFVTSFGSSGKQFKAKLTGLQANTSYCYSVSQAGTDLTGTSPVFTTALASGATNPFSFAVISDWGANTSDEAKVLSQVAAARPSFIMTGGDNDQASGSQSDYGDLNGGEVFARAYWPQVGRTIPAFPALGNHGFTTNLPHLQNWPQDATVASDPGARYQQDVYCCTSTLGSSNYTYASAWYAFDWGNSRFYVIDAAWSDSTGEYQGDFDAHFNGPVAGCTVCGTQLTWLTNDLASHAPMHKFAFFHYPLYVDSPSQPTDPYLDGPGHLEGVLAGYGVNIVFNGHAHQYERNYPQINGSSMVSYVTGGGGAPLGSVSSKSSFDAYSRAVFEFLLVSVNGSSVTVTPIDENGTSFDVQTYTFGGGPPPVDDFSMAAGPSSLSVVQGQSVSTRISTLVTSGAAQSVSLSVAGLPAGTSADFNPASLTAGGSSTLTLTSSAATPLGTVTVTVSGTGTSASHTIPISLSVSAPPPPPGAGPRLVQAAGGHESASSSSLTASFAAPTTQGDLLVLLASVYTGATNQITKVSDSAGNSWKKIGAYYAAGHYSEGEMWYAANAAPVSGVTVSLTTATVVALEVEEFSGMAASNPLDVATGASNTGMVAASGGATPGLVGELAVGFVGGHGSSQAITVTASGYSNQAQQSSSNGSASPVSLVAGYQVLSSNTPQSFTGRFSSSMYWAAGIALFKPAAG